MARKYNKNRKKECAIYGNTSLIRMRCYDCGTMAFVIDGQLQCCGRDIDESRRKTIPKNFYETPPRAKRKSVPFTDRAEILELQSYKCIYCGKEFGTSVWRKGKLVILKICFDHFVPFSFSFDNHKYNYLASCQICNSIKNDKMFDTIDEAREYIRVHT